MNKTESVVCDVCKSDQHTLLFPENGYNTVKCSDCGLIYINPRPVFQALFERYASQEYFDAHEGHYEDWLDNSKKKLEILQRIKHGKRLLEIGMAKGFFLKAASEAGYNVTGIDISPYAVSYVEKVYNFSVQATMIEDANFEHLFDVVCFFDVLSHVPSPTKFFKGIANHLKPNGILFCRVGDKGRQWESFRQGKWYAPDHLYHFSRPLLEKCLNDVGLSVIKTFPAFDSEYPYLHETFVTDKLDVQAKIKALNIEVHTLAMENGLMDDYYLIAQKDL